MKIHHALKETSYLTDTPFIVQFGWIGKNYFQKSLLRAIRARPEPIHGSW
jgi:hypothetical protein